ncbi:MAG TPA: glycosyltransferase [Polyangia bacterium]|nr:glycosyltransferase [Polyangia bacterium]
MSLKVAYLVNQYPAVSHSFIRREITALEANGVDVLRFSVRPPPTALVDAADQAEEKRTRVLLSAGGLPLLAAAARTALAAPRALAHALAATVRLGRRSERGVLRHVIYLAEACLLLKWIRDAGGAQHVHAHFGTNSTTVALLANLLGGPSFSFTSHGPEEYDHASELSLGEKIERSAAVVAVSDFGRSQLYRQVSLDHWPKVHVIRCGVDASFLSGPQPVADNRRLVCVGRLVEQKGQLLILDALAGLAREGVDVELVLVGDGPLRSIIETRAAELGIAGRVRITGWMSNAAVRDEIVAGRVMLLPSFAEGLPVVLMEALGLGRPAITTYVAGIPELVENGRNGWLIPAGSVEAMKRAIKDALATSAEDLARMGRAGAEAVAERHDASREASRLAEIFRRVVGERERTPAAEPATNEVGPEAGKAVA